MLSPVQQGQTQSGNNQQANNPPARTHDDATLADGPLSAEQFVDGLIDEATSHRAAKHPYLDSLSSGSLPDMRAAIVDFARIYYAYTAHFPRYLTAAISRLDDASQRRALVENLTEESGSYHESDLAQLERAGIRREWIDGIPHPELFRRFREALGISGDDGIDDIEAVCWREMFYDTIAHGSAAEAIGALGLGTETIVKTIYAHIFEALRRLPMAADEIVFFPLHCTVDDAHHETLRRIAIDFARSEQGRRGLRLGMRKALLLRSGFWDYLFERAQSGATRKAA